MRQGPGAAYRPPALVRASGSCRRGVRRVEAGTSVRVWVDLTNSPHALFFAPIARELTARGDQVLVTARRFAHTVPLAEKLFESVTVVGSGERQRLSGKVAALGGRVRALLPVVAAFGPDVAVAHGSYDQPLAARWLGVPQLTMVDYEHHPATHLLFRAARRLLLPEAFPRALVNQHGGRGKTWRYRGLKEEVYLADLDPGTALPAELGLDGYAGKIVTLRPPAVGAMYHRDENPLFPQVVEHLAAQPDTVTLILPRHPAQAPSLAAAFAGPTVRVVEQPIDGPALVWHSDVVISAGGTMNREAVALGVPVWTMFAGRMGSVDRALIASGAMHRLATPADIDSLVIGRRSRGELPSFDHDVRGQVIRAIERTAALGRRPRPGASRSRRG